MYLLAFYVVPLVYVQSFVTYVVMYLFIKTLQLHHQRDLRLQHTILNKDITHKILTSQTYNLCNPFNPDLHCASYCGIEFVFKKDGEKRAQWRSGLKGLQRLYVKLLQMIGSKYGFTSLLFINLYLISFQTNIYVFIMNIVVCYWISWISVALNPELSYLIFRFWAVEFYLEHFLRTFLNWISSCSTPIHPQIP